jgi:hypothetical protein
VIESSREVSLFLEPFTEAQECGGALRSACADGGFTELALSLTIGLALLALELGLRRGFGRLRGRFVGRLSAGPVFLFGLIARGALVSGRGASRAGVFRRRWRTFLFGRGARAAGAPGLAVSA